MAESESATNSSKPPREWVGEVFAQLEDRLIGFVYRRIGDFEIAQDVVQEAFVKLCQQSWPEIEERAEAWLYRTCRNRVIDLVRREGRRKGLRSGTDVSVLRDPESSLPEDAMSQNEQLNRVRESLQELPERQQELLRLRLQEGLSYKQIAEVTGLTVTNVGYLLHKTISRLRGSLNAQ
ncbi:MAG: RNA polymerase sigma factor [Aureliella sp.]